MRKRGLGWLVFCFTLLFQVGLFGGNFKNHIQDTIGCDHEIVSSQNQKRHQAPVTVMTFNIRYDTPQDGENQWANRKEKVAKTILNSGAQVIGIQEALHHQCLELHSFLPGFSWVGVGRDDGKQKGEFSPIFYQKKFWKLLDWGTFWLSPTPEKPSKGWDAALPRILTWGKFKHKRSKKKIFVFNTHFDHRGQKARLESTNVIRKKIQQIAGNELYILTGDFNFTPDKAPYKNLIHSENGISIVDSKLESTLPPKGPEGTYSGFQVVEKNPQNRIDYIFIHPQLESSQYEVITTSYEGHYPSDHLPVVCKIILARD